MSGFCRHTGGCADGSWCQGRHGAYSTRTQRGWHCDMTGNRQQVQEALGNLELLTRIIYRLACLTVFFVMVVVVQWPTDDPRLVDQFFQ